MKQYITLLYVVVILVLIVSVSVSINQIESHKEEISRLKSNLSAYGDSVSVLNLTAKEYAREVEKGNLEISRIDSVLKSRNIKIKQLENYIATNINININDTTFLEVERSVPVYLTPGIAKFKSNFKETKDCISIAGFVISSDPSPQVAITNRSVKVRVDDITVSRKWWQFWKPKTQRTVTSECGDVTIQQINKK